MVSWTSFTFQQKSNILFFMQQEKHNSNVYRYILDEEYQVGRSFIWHENAHLDITFSCVAFINSCMPLLPENSTATQMATIIAQRLYGLEVYADMFWCTHLLEYCSLLRQHSEFSTDLLAQLKLLLRFRKDDSRALVQASQTRMEEEATEAPSLEALNQWPDIKGLVSDILVFRAKISQEDLSDKPVESMSSPYASSSL